MEDISFFLGAESVAIFPASSVLPYETAARSLEHTAQRLKVNKLTLRNQLVVAPIQALLSKMIPPEVVKKFTIRFRVGEQFQWLKLYQSSLLWVTKGLI